MCVYDDVIHVRVCDACKPSVCMYACFYATLTSLYINKSNNNVSGFNANVNSVQTRVGRSCACDCACPVVTTRVPSPSAPHTQHLPMQDLASVTISETSEQLEHEELWCVCVCVCVRERERESVCECVHRSVFTCVYMHKFNIQLPCTCRCVFLHVCPHAGTPSPSASYQHGILIVLYSHSPLIKKNKISGQLET